MKMFNSGYILIVVSTVYFTYFIYRFIRLFIKSYISFWICPIIYLVLLVISLPAVNFLDIKAVIYYHILVIALLLELIYFLIKKYSFSKYIIPTGLACAVLVTGVFVYGYYNMNHIVQTKYQLHSNKIDYLKIALIADLHMGVSINQQKLQKICDEINDEKPDLVILAGDIFDENTTYQEMQDACTILGAMYQRQGIYYVFGNHDQNLYTNIAQYAASDITASMEKNGIKVLDDEVVETENLTIIGRGDARFYNDGTRLSMSDLYINRNDNHYVIVIDHQPLDLETNAALGCDLQVSGHTHGGQLFPQGLIQSLTSDTLVYGKRQINQFTAITTSGLSGWRYPIKTGAPSEYVIIEINE